MNPIDEQDLEKQLRQLLADSKESLTKSQIAKILEIKGDQRVLLKNILKRLEVDGILHRGPRRRLTSHVQSLEVDQIIPVEVTFIDDSGHYYATPIDWTNSDDPPTIRLVDLKRSHTEGRGAFAIGMVVIVRLFFDQNHPQWLGSVIKSLSKERSRIHVGIFEQDRHSKGGRLAPCHRKDKMGFVYLAPNQAADLKPGDVIEYKASSLHGVTILRTLGKIADPFVYSRIAASVHGLPDVFPEEAIKLAEKGKVPPLGDRVDLRNIPLVTIDGEDARDFDDAVWAKADEDLRNPGGWRIIVAIADVAYYVRPEDALDKEALKRGNSVYFPDRVIPMLPEALSNEMCSLKPNVDRACMAIEMILSADGKIKSHRVKRGLMRSVARLTYTQVQKAIDGRTDELTESLMDEVIKPLYGAYRSLLKARTQRGTLNIEGAERQILLSEKGYVLGVKMREQMESHKLIEEFMIAANVAAAKTLLAKSWPCLFRVHDVPSGERILNLRQVLKQFHLSFPKTTEPNPHQFNAILHAVDGKPFQRMVNDLILRSQAQACYSPHNIGHYGLSLAHYAHFTSPIRRYSDLVVHRALISALNLGDGGYPQKPDHLDQIALHISATERQAAAAERDVVDRFMISYMEEHVGEEFSGTIVGVNAAGIFVETIENGAQGFIARQMLPDDYYVHDEEQHRLIGRRSGKAFQLGDIIRTQLVAADVMSCSLAFSVAQFGSVKNTSAKKPTKKFEGKFERKSEKKPFPHKKAEKKHRKRKN